AVAPRLVGAAVVQLARRARAQLAAASAALIRSASRSGTSSCIADPNYNWFRFTAIRNRGAVPPADAFVRNGPKAPRRHRSARARHPPCRARYAPFGARGGAHPTGSEPFARGSRPRSRARRHLGGRVLLAAQDARGPVAGGRERGRLRGPPAGP